MLKPKVLLTAIRAPAVTTTLSVTRDLDTFARIGFLRVAIRSGLLDAIGDGAARTVIATRLGVVNNDLLEGLLAVGVALGEIGGDAGRYTLKGRRAKAVASSGNDALQALLLEVFEYHGSVYDRLPARLRGEPPGDYLAETATLVARSSRIAEPFIGTFIEGLVKERQPPTLLEVGCGTGVYVRYAAEASRGLRCTAVDMQADVVEMARRNVAEWGLADRVSVEVADVRDLPAELSGPYDLITLHNNIYYFATAERSELFAALAGKLTGTGAICVVSMMAGNTVASTDLDLTLRSTAGCAPLPKLDELQAQLRQAGLSTVVPTHLMPLEPLYAVVAGR